MQQGLPSATDLKVKRPSRAYCDYSKHLKLSLKCFSQDSNPAPLTLQSSTLSTKLSVSELLIAKL